MARAIAEAGAMSSEEATEVAWPIQTSKAANGKKGCHVQLCRLFTAQGCSVEAEKEG